MKMISVSEAAGRLGLSVQRVRALIAEGRLKAQKIARDWAIPESALEKITVHGKAGRPRNTFDRTATKKRRSKTDKEAKEWKTYEEVAIYLLGQMKDKFGLGLVEGKQKIKGKKSGTTYDIEGKGIRTNNEAIIIIECRRYTTARQSQDRVGGLAYRILDTGAGGGIIVSPLGLQSGAKKIAKAENIHSVRLAPNSTRTDFILRFLNEVMLGTSDSIAFWNDHVETEIK